MKMHLRDVPKQIALSFAAGTNIGFVSQPGIGKTETISEAARKLGERVPGFKMVEIDVPSMSPTDIGVYFPNMEARTLEFFANGGLPNVYTDGEDAKGIAHMGELLNCDAATGKLLQKWINGEDINGKLRKPKGFIVVADSNRLSDKSHTQQQSRALLSRIEWIEVYSDAEGNLQFMERNNFHPTIQAFAKEFPALIDNYSDVFETKGGSAEQSALQEEGKMGRWACMRGWKRLSDLETAAESMGMELMPQRAIANLGNGVGTQYNTFRMTVNQLATVEEIVKHPDTTPVPERADMQ